MAQNKGLLTWRDTWRLNRRAYQLMDRRHPKMLRPRLICIVWDSLTPYVGIYLSAMVVAELAGGQSSLVLTRLVLLTLCTAAVISLVAALLHRWRDTQCSGLYYGIMQIFSEKMMSMDYADADLAETHTLLNTIGQNMYGGGWGLDEVYENVEAALSALLTMLGGGALTLTLFTTPVPATAGSYTVLNHPLVTVLILVLMLAITCISPLLSNKAGSYYALNADSHNLGNRMFGFFGFLGHHQKNAADVRIYRQDLICDKYSRNKTRVFASKGIFAKLARGPMGFYKAASSGVSVLFTGVVYAFVCLKALGGAFGIGAVTQYIASITKLFGSISSLINAAGDMRNNASFLQQIFQFLDIPNWMYQGSLTVEKRMDREYEIEFRHVSFRYPGSTTDALKDVSFKFHVGTRLAVVGRNGSGKTTFIKLLCRLYDPTEGEILLNGIDIRKYDYAEYLSVFSVVFQDFQLLAYQLGQNIAAAASYDSLRAEQCLTDAGFHERMETLPDGLHTYLYQAFFKKGIDVSGGEAQKIALARALYKDAPFIVLDEPTAALDPVAESEVYTSFDQLVGDKTAIYISHRLSSCRFCDDILVFDSGSIVQQGSHDSLVADAAGMYHKMWHAQAQYYAEHA